MYSINWKSIEGAACRVTADNYTDALNLGVLLATQTYISHVLVTDRDTSRVIFRYCFPCKGRDEQLEKELLTSPGGTI